MLKSKAFSVVGLILGCVAFSISVTSIVFSTMGLIMSKKHSAEKKHLRKAEITRK